MLAATALVVGLLLPPDEPEAASIRRGALAAVAEANASTGPEIVLKIRGRTGPWGSDAAEAARLVEEDGASVLLSPPDGAATHLVLQVSGRTGVPVVTLCADSSVTKTAVPWVARAVPSTVEQARSVFARTRLAHWLAIVPRGRAGREAARDLAAAARSAEPAPRAPGVAGGGAPPRGAVTASEGPRLETLEEGSWSGPDDLRKTLSRTRPDAVLVWLAGPWEANASSALRAAGHSGPVVLRSQAMETLRPGGPEDGAASPLEAYSREAVRLAVRLLRGPHGSEPRLAFPLPGGYVQVDRRPDLRPQTPSRIARSSP